MDVARLIEEVRIRPPLWDIRQHHNKIRDLSQLWKQVADVLNVDNVEQCKRKWRNLRDAYRALVKQSEQKIARDKELGVYTPEKDYDSKWVHFAALGFIKHNTRQKRPLSAEPDYSMDSSGDDDIYTAKLDNEYKIKIESTHTAEEDINKFAIDINDDDEEGDDEKWDFDEQMLVDEFQNTPLSSQQPLPSHKTAEIRVGNFPIALKQNPDFELLRRQIPANISVAILPTNETTGSIQQPAPPPPSFTTLPSANKGGAQKNCQCSSSSSAKQVNFLQNLEHEEQQLMQSTREDMKRTTDHTGDPDYNFLVSFLPQMKKMNDLQSLQFRSRMCEMVLNILAPTMSAAAMPSQPPPLTAGPGFRLQPTQQHRPAGSAVYYCNGDGRTGGGGNVTINAATSTSCTFIP